MKKTVSIIFVALGIVMIVLGGFFYFKYSKNPDISIEKDGISISAMVDSSYFYVLENIKIISQNKNPLV